MSEEARAYCLMINEARSHPTPPPASLHDASALAILAASYEPPAPTCATCGDLGYLRLAVAGSIHTPGFGQLTVCPDCGAHENPEAWRDYLVKLSNLRQNELHHKLTYFFPETLQRAQAKTHAERLLEAGAGWLTLWGCYGSGKSFLATAIVNAAIDQRKEARYWSMAGMLDALRDAYDPKRSASDFSTLFDELAACPLLVVDECSDLAPTEWALEKTRQLTESRYRDADRLMTVWVCNLDPRTARGPLDKLFSRMTEFPLAELNEGDVRPQVSQDRGVYHMP